MKGIEGFLDWLIEGWNEGCMHEEMGDWIHSAIYPSFIADFNHPSIPPSLHPSLFAPSIHPFIVLSIPPSIHNLMNEWMDGGYVTGRIVRGTG